MERPPKLVFLTSPGNPTGTVIPPDSIRPLLEHPTWKGLVVVDEGLPMFLSLSASPSLIVSFSIHRLRRSFPGQCRHSVGIFALKCRPASKLTQHAGSMKATRTWWSFRRCPKGLVLQASGAFSVSNENSSSSHFLNADWASPSKRPS